MCGNRRWSKLPVTVSRQRSNMGCGIALVFWVGRTLILRSLTRIGGCSAGSTGTRSGLSGLIADIILGQVGIVIVSEVSRRARNLSEWGGLLDFCSTANTLIADAESLYDLKRYNDRFLLGIRGTMSEAELHIIRQRMHAGREAKAARGALRFQLPRGYVRTERDDIVLDPDQSVQARIASVFALFRKHNSLSKVLRELASDGQGLPVRRAHGERRGVLEWPQPSSCAIYSMLTSPIYAGAFCWGRAPGQVGALAVEERWRYVIKDCHLGYISWSEFELNKKQLSENRWPVRNLQGGLLSGLLRCHWCDLGMSVHYQDQSEDGVSDQCRGQSDMGGKRCQSLSSSAIDTFVSQASLAVLAPAAIDSSLKALALVEDERTAQHEQWRLRLQRANTDVAAAERAWRSVEYSHRLVAQTLEDEWEAALTERRQLQNAYQRYCDDASDRPSEAEIAAIRQAAFGISQVWDSGHLSTPEKAKLLRLLIRQVRVGIIGRSERVQVQIDWHGGETTQTEIQRPVARLDCLSDYPHLCASVRELKANGCSHEKIAEILTREGWRPAQKDQFNEGMIARIVQQTGIGQQASPRGQNVPIDRRPHEWTIEELAAKTNCTKSTLYQWVQDKS